MAEYVLDACDCVQHAAAIDAFAKAEFAADGDLAFQFRFVGEESRRHLAGVDEHEWCVEQGGDLADLIELGGIGDRVEGGAESESAFTASGVDVDHDAHAREDVGLDEWAMRYEMDPRALPGKARFHVDAIEGRDALVGGARTVAELRHKQHAPADLAGIELLAERLTAT